MSQSDIQRRMYGKRFIVIPLGLPTAATGLNNLTNMSSTITDSLSFVVPFNMILTNVGVSVLSGDAASSALTVTVRRGSTSLLAATSTAGTAASAILSADGAVQCSRAEQLIISVTCVNNSTDDFSGASVTLVFEPEKTDS